ncbi:hypothetical protein SEA_MANDALORIAN_59 [Microbacterium phage Mandalorian]|nr:hypothetical protein SEA_MANDALORIAN_59 [Microbacterium phage Mandalorian]
MKYTMQCPNVQKHEGHTWQEPEEGELTCLGHTEDPLNRLMGYADTLHGGGELTPKEQADLEAIGQYVAEMIQQFIVALQEALQPVLEGMVQALENLWHSIPEEVRAQLTEKEVVPPRAERQRAADLAGRPMRIEAVGRDLAADVAYFSAERNVGRMVN